MSYDSFISELRAEIAKEESLLAEQAYEHSLSEYKQHNTQVMNLELEGYRLLIQLAEHPDSNDVMLKDAAKALGLTIEV